MSLARRNPAFVLRVNARKNLFYCHGCSRGGDLIRFVQLSRHLSFRQSPAYLEQQTSSTDDSVSAVLQQTTTFYREQLDHYPEAMRYLHQRGLQDPALIQQLQIGYAFSQAPRGACMPGSRYSSHNEPRNWRRSLVASSGCSHGE